MKITLGKLNAFLILIGALAVSAFAQSAQAEDAEKPNVVVIMADDLGYGDVSCYGATELTTPNIDKLASEGIRFTSGYCSASTCTPTRFSLLTGTYAFRQKGTGIARPNNPSIIKAGTVTVASLLQDAGYETAVIGKWHLGLGNEKGPDWNGKLSPGPLEIGFDECFLLPTTNDRVPQVYVKDHKVLNLDPKDPLWVGMKKPSPDHPTGLTHRDTLKMDWSHGHNSTIHNGISRIGFYTGGHAARFRDEDLADKWVEQSVKFMESNKDKPFFLFFSSHDIHVPRMPHERFHGKTKLGFRGDAIAQLDWCVGELMKTLDRLDLTKKTLVVFCSDNGPVLDDGYKDGAVEKLGKHKPAGPFSGGKYTIQEGGTRTPFITRMPGKIQPGVSDKLVCTIDLAASFAKMNHVEIPKDACLDSFDVLDALMGEKGAKGRDHLVQQDNGRRGILGFRMGQWKLHKGHAGGKFKGKKANAQKPKYSLFDLSKDIGETKNVAAQNPDITKMMSEKLAEIVDSGRSRASN